jgi:type IX secretion system substrate protein
MKKKRFRILSRVSQHLNPLRRSQRALTESPRGKTMNFLIFTGNKTLPMKKYFLLIIFSFSYCKFSAAQILCIYCYDQNDSISAGVNNLLLNGGFENTTCTPAGGIIGALTSFCPSSNGYVCDITNWTCTGGGTNTYACLFDNTWSIIAEGNYALYFGNHYCNACSSSGNDTSCLNNKDCTVTGIPAGYPLSEPAYGTTAGVSLEQTVSGLITGNTYVLEFWAGGENFTSERGLFAADVGFGDTLLRNKHTDPNSADIGTRYIIEFIATSSSHTIKFTNWGHICNACTELVLDDVRLYTLAELDASVPHCTVGISPTPAAEEAALFPNPVTNELNVKTNTNDVSEIIFYDIASRKFLQQTFINAVSINTEKFSKGIYFYEIKNKEGVVKKGKVIKE